MAKRQTVAPEGDWRSEAMSGAAHVLLLVPEAPLIGALLCVYWGLGEPPLIGIVVALLIVGFITRWLALLGARLALEAARFREADALAQIALALHPWSADALGLRGTAALVNGQAEEAEVALRRAIGLLPAQANFHAALAGALLAQNRPVEAGAAARAGLALAPEHAIAHLYLAESARLSGAPAEAVEERLRAGLAAASLPETEAAIRCALGAHLLAEHRVAEAMLTLHGAEALLPRCRPAPQIELRVRLGELLIAQGQIERAREQFRNVAEMDPNGRFSRAAWRASHLI
jgi:tetratricopeptide (TPR) repeat protein